VTTVHPVDSENGPPVLKPPRKPYTDISRFNRTNNYIVAWICGLRCIVLFHDVWNWLVVTTSRADGRRSLGVSASTSWSIDCWRASDSNVWRRCCQRACTRHRFIPAVSAASSRHHAYTSPSSRRHLDHTQQPPSWLRDSTHSHNHKPQSLVV